MVWSRAGTSVVVIATMRRWRLMLPTTSWAFSRVFDSNRRLRRRARRFPWPHYVHPLQRIWLWWTLLLNVSRWYENKVNFGHLWDKSSPFCLIDLLNAQHLNDLSFYLQCSDCPLGLKCLYQLYKRIAIMCFQEDWGVVSAVPCYVSVGLSSARRWHRV